MKYIYTQKAPTPGKYSQAVLVDPLTHKLLFLSGQTGNDINLKDEMVVDGGVGPQTTQALKNLLVVVEAAGGDVSSFVHLTVYLRDSGSEQSRQNNWHQYNEACYRFFVERGVEKLPARDQTWPVDVPWATEPTVVEIKGIAEILRIDPFHRS